MWKPCSLRIKWVVSLFLFLAIFSCKQQNPPPTTGDDDDDTPLVPVLPVVPSLPEPGFLTDSDFWGYWISSDTQEVWYITDRTVTQVGTKYDISGWNGTILSTAAHSFTKKSTNMLSVNSGSFYLYRKSGARSSIAGKIGGQGTGTQDAARGKALSLVGIGSIEVIISNIVNSANSQLLIPLDDGSFEMPKVVPTDTYIVATKITNEGVESAGPAIVVKPSTGFNDLGTLTVTKLERNFKITCPRWDYPYAVANGSVYNDYSLVIQNIGTVNAQGLIIRIVPDSGLNVALNSAAYTVNQDGSINIPGILYPSGASANNSQANLPLLVSCAEIQDELEYKKIAVSLVDSGGNTWDDSVSLKFYRKTTTIRVASLGARISGYVFAPEEESLWFNTSLYGGRYQRQFDIPYSSRGYKISFSKGSEVSSVKYSFVIDSDTTAEPASDAAIEAGDGVVREPNDSEDQLWPIAFGEVLIDSISGGDVDFFDIGGRTAAPVISPAGGSYTAEAYTSLSCFSETSFPEETSIRYTLDGIAPEYDTGFLYEGPILVDRSASLTCRAFTRSQTDASKTLVDSNAVSAAFSFSCQSCVLSENAGAWSATTDTPSPIIHFTRDGSDPATSVTAEIYDSGYPPVPTANEILIFRVFRDGWTPSAAVANRGPFVSFTASPATVIGNDPVSFDASGTTAPGPLAAGIELSWDFGDGSTTDWASISLTAASIPSHSYASSGFKTVRLRARDAYGMVEETIKRVLVLSPSLSGFELVPVAGGTFTMGDDGSGFTGPSHQISLTPFYISKYEITNGQYGSLYSLPSGTLKKTEPSIPVQYVEWFDAVKFCNRLSIAEGLEPVYSISGNGTDPSAWPVIGNGYDTIFVDCDWTKIGYRLPTEAEWEYAAIGAKQAREFDYPGSADYDALGWYTGNSTGAPQVVGTKAANQIGLFDMGGNVAEWCWDWHGSYTSDAQIDPRGSTSPATNGYKKVLRGGSWSGFSSFMWVYWRDSNTPNSTVNTIGFRLAMNVFLGDP